MDMGFGGRYTQGRRPFYYDFRGEALHLFPRRAGMPTSENTTESKEIYAETQGMKAAKKGNWPRVVFWAKRWLKLQETK
jgi:hypothetical protein